MADADDMCDKSQLPPVPQVKVVTLVNNFITNTVSFLNVFATSAEEKLSGVAQRISGVELTLALLEAKLNSVPGVADVAPVAPREAPAAAAPAEPPSDALTVPWNLARYDAGTGDLDGSAPVLAAVRRARACLAWRTSLTSYARFGCCGHDTRFRESLAWTGFFGNAAGLPWRARLGLHAGDGHGELGERQPSDG